MGANNGLFILKSRNSEFRVGELCNFDLGYAEHPLCLMRSFADSPSFSTHEAALRHAKKLQDSTEIPFENKEVCTISLYRWNFRIVEDDKAQHYYMLGPCPEYYIPGLRASLQ